MNTKLAHAQKIGPGAAAAAAVAASRFTAALAGSQEPRDIVVPRLNLPGKLVVVGAERVVAIEGELEQAMDAIGLSRSELTQGDWETARAVRTLADAIRDPDDLEQPLGTVAEWGQLSVETIAEVWREYQDERERQDPAGVSLSVEDAKVVRLAIEKKNATALRYFGVRRLADYLLITAGQPATSPTPRPSSGDLSPES